MNGSWVSHIAGGGIKCQGCFAIIDRQLDIMADRLYHQPGRRIAKHQDRTGDPTLPQFDAFRQRGDGKSIHAGSLGNRADDADIVAIGIGLHDRGEQRFWADDGANTVDVVDQRVAIDFDPGGAVGLLGRGVVGHRCLIL